MDANATFEIGALEEKEAWELFKKITGNLVESDELRSLTTKVARRCAGLPISITTVAGALRNDSSSTAWEDALMTLENPSPINFTADVSAEAYTAIKLSYDHIKRQDYRQTFLLCCLLGHNAYISDLLRCAIGLGFFTGVKTVEGIRNRVLAAISKFKESCLLLDDCDDECFDMHDMVRDVALAIASSDSHAFELKHEGFLDDWPDENTLPKESHLISMSFGGIKKLPLALEYPQLSLLSMDSTDAYVEMFPSTFFGKTTGIKVLYLSKIDFVSMSSSINLPTSLRTLCLNQCVVGDIGNIGELKNLEILTFRSCNIEMLPDAIGQLTKLTLLDLSDCRGLKIIAPGVLSNLSRLEELYLAGTRLRWEEERQASQGIYASLSELMALARLTTLEVQIPDPEIVPKDLFSPNLERFKIGIGNYAMHWFDMTEYTRELNLDLNTSIDEMEDWAKTLLRKSEALYLKDLGSAKIVFKELGNTEGFFLRLKNLSIEAASEIQYIIDATGAVDKIEFRQLRSLTLSSLPELVGFCSVMKEASANRMPQPEPHDGLRSLFGEQVVFSCLEKLTLSSVNVRRIWDSKSYCITSLKSLTIRECSNLEHLFSASMAKNMVNLERLLITGCKSLRKIILVENIPQENEVDIIFPRLISLVLSNLEHFSGFCSEDRSVRLKFPSLTELEIEKCLDLKGFISEDINNSQAVLFNEKVEFPSLRELKMAKLRNINIIWHNQRQQFPANSFSKLTKMVIEDCNELVSIFPSCILEGLKQLVYVSVDDCASLERLFELQSSNKQKAVATQLGRLILKNLPKLKHVWNDNSQEAFTFEDLREVEITHCHSLVNVFPASVARALRQLQVLDVASCGVEEIVSREKGVKKNVSFEFDQLSTLMLLELPNLICFYPGMHTIEWPMLKRLSIYHCNRVKTFYTEGSNIQEMEPPPLFLAEKVIPKLEELTLNRDDIEMMCESQVSSNLFQEIKQLHMQCYHEKSSIFPFSNFLGRFKKLQSLSVICSVFTELFSFEFRDSSDVAALSQIRNLSLHAVTGLKHIWMQDSRTAHLLPNLQSLVIRGCKDMISLGLASSPLESLTTLEVVNCKAIIHLVTSSAIQSLVQLKLLSIKECISLKEVVIGNKEDEATYKITFSKLRSFVLEHLPNFTSFCSSNHTFDFPSLEQLVVRQCPELRTFCHGAVSVPKLRYIQVSDRHSFRNAGLNQDIQDLHADKVGYHGIRYLVLSTPSKCIEAWNGMIDFKLLEYLEVYDCGSLRNIFTASMVSELQQLRELMVKRCDLMKQIIKSEGVEESTSDIVLFPSLRSVTLESCGNLTSFYLGGASLECPCLESVTVTNCAKMLVFASAFLEEQEMETFDGERLHTPPFFGDKVLFPRLKKLTLSSMNIQRIWPELLHDKSYPQILEELTVKLCNNLRCIFSSSTVQYFLKLQIICIENCENLKEVVFREALLEEEAKMSQIFPCLQLLLLKDLSRLGRFCHASYLHFPMLKMLTVENCPIFVTFVSGSVNETYVCPETEGNKPVLFNEKVAFPILEELRIIDMENCRRIWPDRLSDESFCELNLLRVYGCGKLHNVFPFNMRERLGNLEELQISMCGSLEEIFEADQLQNNSTMTPTKSVFPKVKYLQLYRLPELKSFYSMTHTTQWPSLQKMWLCGCDQVEIFASENLNVGESTVQNPLFWVNKDTFPNLEELKLEYNDNMKEIWRGRHGAEFFLKLRRMDMIGCENMEEIIACKDDDEVEGGIEFPVLEKVIVRMCPKLQIFCAAAEIRTPMLHGVQFLESPDEDCWEDNLNNTIQRLFREKVGGCEYGILTLSESYRLMEIWRRNPQGILDLKGLKILEVYDCSSLRCLFNLSMALDLAQLSIITVKKCCFMEHIIAVADEETDGKFADKIILFPLLECIVLESCADLKSFYQGSRVLEFPSLTEIEVDDCPQMTAFSEEPTTENINGQMLLEGAVAFAGSAPFFNDAVLLPNLKELILRSMNITKIWPESLHAKSYPQILEN